MESTPLQCVRVNKMRHSRVINGKGAQLEPIVGLVYQSFRPQEFRA